MTERMMQKREAGTETMKNTIDVEAHKQKNKKNHNNKNYSYNQTMPVRDDARTATTIPKRGHGGGGAGGFSILSKPKSVKRLELGARALKSSWANHGQQLTPFGDTAWL